MLYINFCFILGNLNFNNQWSSSTATTTSAPTLPTNSTSPIKVPPTTPQHFTTTPSHQFAPPTTPQHAPATTPQHQAKSPMETRPDYSRSHFDNAFTKKNEPKEKPKSTDVFGDLLGSQGYQFSAKKDNSPRTINQMRKEEMVKEMDPEKLKVMEWVRTELLAY